MTDKDFSRPPLHLYSRPGSVAVSNQALEIARQILDTARLIAPDRKWIAVFHWADQRRTREKGTNNWFERGPGVDAGAIEESDVPAAAIATIDDVPVAIQIPLSIVERLEEKTIDRDNTVFGRIRLR